MFIVFEGTEGTGKTTQVKLLAKFLKRKGYKIKVTYEPGGTFIADKIRNVLLSPKSKNMTSLTELLLYMASRTQHVEEVIKPAIGKGYIVISDRFSESTLAYQGYGRRLSISLIRSLDRIVTKGLQPDLVIILDSDVKTGLRRIIHRKKKLNRLDKENLNFYNRVRKGFLALSKENPKRIKIIKMKSIKETQKEIQELVKNVLKKYNRPKRSNRAI